MVITRIESGVSAGEHVLVDESNVVVHLLQGYVVDPGLAINRTADVLQGERHGVPFLFILIRVVTWCVRRCSSGNIRMVFSIATIVPIHENRTRSPGQSLQAEMMENNTFKSEQK